MGVNNNRGYILLDMKKVYRMDGKLFVPKDKSITEEEAIRMGFPPINAIYS